MGISQRELAARMGYKNHSSIVQIENGKVDLPQTRIVQFSEVLNVSLAYLLGWEDEPEDMGALAADMLLTPGASDLVKAFMACDEADKAMLCSLAASLAAKNKKS